ncbi:threonine/serine dehydratase [candidate division KSB1 bacterium]|nr:MAG: threonine/serine dehydratase [candidate division KSB1 bacterium]MBC6948148.1 threonine/serine dehydratase [candidate division KSB1 bacterium]MCE7944677.1 threonine/serine dehydratase [Chlorobi bacterium CHB1]MDL1879076.1 threonine/serine dehydratase [Cytophagia bacterium CHB2]
MQKITLIDVFKARQTIAPFLKPTPLYSYHGLSKLLDAPTYVKHENHQPVGAFKVRGGVNLICNLSPEEKQRGVMTASTGNHGQSVAYASRLFGVRATIMVPEGANPVKVETIRALGAEIVFHGRDFDEARVHAEEQARTTGSRFVSSGDEPWLISGVGTYALEILDALPEVATIIVPVGSGSGVAGCCVAAKAINPHIRVIGVQAEKAPSAYLSWKSGKRVEAKMETFAEGLATRVPFDLPQAIIRELLDDFVLVSDDEIRAAMRLLIEHTRNLPEAAGAASLAAALKLKGSLAGKPLALVLSGGNITLKQLQEVVAFTDNGVTAS